MWYQNWRLKFRSWNEIDGPVKNKTWKIVCYSEVFDDANILNRGFVHTIKDPGIDREKYNAYIVVHGHKDFAKKCASLWNFRCSSTVCTNGHLNSRITWILNFFYRRLADIPAKCRSSEQKFICETLLRIWARPRQNYQAFKTALWDIGKRRLLKTNISKTYHKNHRYEVMYLWFSAGFYKYSGQKLKGMCVTNIDDTLYDKTKEYSGRCEHIEKTFTCKLQERNSTNFTGLTI